MVVQVDRSPGQGKADQEDQALHDPTRHADDRSGTEGHRGVVALLLEESHPGGEHRRRAPGQRAEAVGHLDGHHSSERQVAGNAPEILDGVGYDVQLCAEEGDDDPPPVRPDDGVEGVGHVDQDPDERPPSDERADGQDERGPADPPGFRQLGYLDRRGVGSERAHLLEECRPAPQGPGQHGVESGAAQVFQDARQQVGWQASGGRRRGLLGPRRQTQCGDGTGQVAVEAVGPGVGGGIAEIEESRGTGTRIDDDGVAAYGAVGDPLGPEREELADHAVEHGIRECIALEVGKAGSARHAADQDGIPGDPGAAGGHDLGHVDLHPLGQQRQVRLVLDLLEAGEGQGGT